MSRELTATRSELLEFRAEARQLSVDRQALEVMSDADLEGLLTELARRSQLAQAEALKRARGPVCSICNDRPVDCVVVPCGHMGACFTCANTCKERAEGCAFCRANVEHIYRTFRP